MGLLSKWLNHCWRCLARHKAVDHVHTFLYFHFDQHNLHNTCIVESIQQTVSYWAALEQRVALSLRHRSVRHISTCVSFIHSFTINKFHSLCNTQRSNDHIWPAFTFFPLFHERFSSYLCFSLTVTFGCFTCETTILKIKISVIYE